MTAARYTLGMPKFRYQVKYIIVPGRLLFESRKKQYIWHEPFMQKVPLCY